MGAVIHGGDDAVPVEREGVGEWGVEEGRGEVGELGRDRLCFIGWVRREEACMEMAGGVRHLVELVKVSIVGVEFRDRCVYIMVDLFR